MEVAKNTCQQMLDQRNWHLEKTEESKFSGSTNNGESFEVFFLDSPKLNIAGVKDCIKILDENNTKHCIIVYNNNITSSARRVISNTIQTIFELFTITELQFNITTHYLVPKHILLDPTETEQFTKIVGTDIPVILKTDPISRFYNFPRGSIIKIIRKDHSVSYRIVR